MPALLEWRSGFGDAWMTAVNDSDTMRDLWRNILVSLVVTMVAAPSAASAQGDDPKAEAEAAEAALAAIGLTFDEVLAEDANSSWDGLGLFSEDSTRLLNAVSEEVPFETYAFGDSKDVPPILEVDGSIATGAGTAVWRLPDDWTPPAEGLGDSMAFAQTPSSQLAPGDDVVLLWLEFDSSYDFSSGLTLNEGFPMTIPGLPVWNSTFAGDTWEGANLIPNAVYDGATLTFDVKGYEPPQSFPLVDLSGFYYRSGNVMSVALSLDALAEFVAAAANSKRRRARPGRDANAAVHRRRRDDDRTTRLGTGPAGGSRQRMDPHRDFAVYAGHHPAGARALDRGRRPRLQNHEPTWSHLALSRGPNTNDPHDSDGRADGRANDDPLDGRAGDVGPR